MVLAGTGFEGGGGGGPSFAAGGGGASGGPSGSGGNGANAYLNYGGNGGTGYGPGGVGAGYLSGPPGTGGVCPEAVAAAVASTTASTTTATPERREAMAKSLSPTRRKQSPNPAVWFCSSPAGVGLFGYGLRRRAARRTAGSKVQDGSPAILSFRSDVSRQPELARRAG